MTRRHPKLLIAAVLVLLLALCLVSALGFVLTTQSGTRWALNRVDAMMPGELDIPSFQGTLWNELTVPSLKYRDDRIEILASNLKVQISWPAAAGGRLVLKSLAADRVSAVSLQTPVPGPRPLELSVTPPGFPLLVLEGNIRKFETRGFGHPGLFEDIRIVQLGLDDQAWRLQSAAVSTLGMRFSPAAFHGDFSSDLPVNGTLDWVLDGSEWSGRVSMHGSLALLQFQQAIQGPLPMTLNGSVRILDRVTPEVELYAEADQWQIEDLAMGSINAELRGTLEQYHAEYRFGLQVPAIPALAVSGTAAGNIDSLETMAATLESTAGRAAVEGRLSWMPGLEADLNVVLSAFDPAAFMEDLTGLLSGQARVLVADAEHIEVSDARLNGELNGVDVRVQADVSFSPGVVRCSDCRFESGDNRISIDGLTGPGELALDVSIDARSLATLWPGLEGSVAGAGRLEGPLELPLFTGSLLGRRLKLDDWSAQEIRIESTSSGLDAVNMSISTGRLAFGDMDLGNLNMTANGARDQLDVDVEWAVQQAVLNARSRVSLSDGGVKGIIRQAGILEPATGEWALPAPLEFSFQQGDLRLEPHRWNAATGSIEVQRFSYHGSDLEISARLAGLPLSLGNPYLPGGYRLGGSASSSIDVVLSGGTWTGVADWQQKDTVVSVTGEDGRQNDISVPAFSVRAQLQNGGVDFVSAISIDPGVNGRATLSLDRLDSGAQITGNLSFEGTQWEWVSALLPEVDRLSGAVTADVNASGPLLSPQLAGSLRWRDGRMMIPALNLTLQDLSLEIEGARDGVALITASATTNGQPIELNGRVDDMFSEQRSLTLDFKGLNAELINWPEYRVWMTPDVTISGDSSGWTFNGKVNVPRAEIDIRELPAGAVKPSPDVRVIGEQQAPVVATRLSGNVRVALGKGVHISVFGLETRLTGDLAVRVHRDRPPTADGVLNLEHGNFEAYGRKLTIEQGTLRFDGPLDNPIVDVRAVRIIEGITDKITAGIHLTGRAKNLSSSIYSVPAMAEADALSYLVLGRPLNQATLAEGNELSGAAIALGLGQANRIAEQVGRSLGLDQLTFAGDGGEATALIAGKQINARLYARFAYGVFNRIGTYLLRYQLSRRLVLEAAAGETQTIDLLYTVEKY